MNERETVQEIFTKCICGRGTVSWEETININNLVKKPSQILGTMTTDYKLGYVTFDAENSKVKVNGSYDLHIWYEEPNGTQIAAKRVISHTVIPIEDYERSNFNYQEAIVQVLHSPECINAEIINGTEIEATVKIALAADVVGETKLKVKAFAGGDEDFTKEEADGDQENPSPVLSEAEMACE